MHVIPYVCRWCRDLYVVCLCMSSSSLHLCMSTYKCTVGLIYDSYSVYYRYIRYRMFENLILSNQSQCTCIQRTVIISKERLEFLSLAFWCIFSPLFTALFCPSKYPTAFNLFYVLKIKHQNSKILVWYTYTIGICRFWISNHFC